MAKKLIDIIIPAYKAHNTIFNTLASIAMQTMAPQIQVTIVNDCCPEGNYQQIINRFKGFLDIKEIKMAKNGGPGAARRFGLESTACPYIMFCDADDTLAASYTVKILYQNLIDTKGEIICSNFLEESRQGTFTTHQADKVWVFAKIYRRAFLKEHNITFTDLRANEDTCFNRKILIAHNQLEKDMQFIDTVTYVWSGANQNSITRTNNAQYKYDQSTVGFVDGMIEAFEWMDKQKIKPELIEQELFSTMIFLYFSYCDVATVDEFYQNQNFEYIKKFYHSVYKRYNFDWRTQTFINLFNDNMENLVSSVQFDYKIFIANPPIAEWMTMLEKAPYYPTDIIEIWKNMPEELKKNNVQSGVVAADFYKRR